jgi:two-component system OmpR family sensor kinase
MLSELEAAFISQGKSEDNLRNFIADASHELRTPLTSIRGYSELLRNSKLDPERFDFALDRISKESNRMWRLVEDLLLLSRLDAGRPLDFKEFDLVTMVAEAILDFQVSFPNYSVEMDLPSRFTIIGDIDRFRQVVSNLLNNVAVHTPENTRIELSVGDSQNMVLRVKDFGPGMTNEQTAKLFDRFYRSSDQKIIQDDYSSISLGLGMAIVKAIVNAHDMNISVISEIGKGTEFRITKKK